MTTEPNEGAFATDFARDGYAMQIGLTKREYFAGIALTGFINTGVVKSESLFSRIGRLFGRKALLVDNQYSYTAIVKSSVIVADLLIEQLNKQP